MNTFNTNPNVSIIIPVRNEEKYIASCIENILSNDYPSEKIEILVIDGESDDNTVNIIKEYERENKNIKLYHNPQRIPYTALNIGLKHARGDVIMRVDTRSIIPKNYINMCIQTLIETGADNVGGTQHQIGRTTKQKTIALAVGHPFGVGNAQFRIGKRSGYVDTVYLGCFRRELFDKIGKFDDDGAVISEDASMNKRIIDAGGKIFLNKDIVVDYPAKESFRDLCRQYFIYGGAKAHIFLKYKSFTSWRQIVPIVFLFSLLFSFIAALFKPPFFSFFAGLCSVYILVDILVSLWISITKEKSLVLLPVLVFAFPCIHFSWAIGFIIRIFEGSRPGKHWRK